MPSEKMRSAEGWANEVYLRLDGARVESIDAVGILIAAKYALLDTIRAAQADALEHAARVAEDIFDSGRHGAHAGEQALRTAAAIRALVPGQEQPHA